MSAAPETLAERLEKKRCEIAAALRSWETAVSARKLAEARVRAANIDMRNATDACTDKLREAHTLIHQLEGMIP